MERTKISHRVLALLLVIIMTMQLLPTSVFAFGELLSVDTGVKLDTMNQTDAINWPIKIYDYLDDGMLFEWNDTQTTGTVADGQNSATSTVPYGGGANPVVTKWGVDYTYNGAVTATDGNYYDDKIVDPVDFQSPRYLHIGGLGYKTTGMGNYQIGSTWSTAKSQSQIRYVALAYRCKGVSNQDLTFALGEWNRTNGIYFQDALDWTYMVIDLNVIRPNVVSSINKIYFLWGFNSGNGRGMASGAYFDISHVGFFDNQVEAENYGKACVTFDKNPGEYLRKATGNFTATTTTVTPSGSLGAILSLEYYWKNADAATGSVIGDEGSTYGLDFTTTSKDKGAYANGYTSATYWTWKNGSQQTYRYTDSNTGVTSPYTFWMDPIGVEQKSLSNGAMYVRLTSEENNKILLSKFREQYVNTNGDVWVPETEFVDQVVLVYRANGLDADDQFGLWAQGHDKNGTNLDAGTASIWKFAGLVDDDVDWTTSSKVRPQDFKNVGQWTYAVLDLNTVIGEQDKMKYITKLNRVGLYLPDMSEGESLDLACVAYFADADTANAFGESALTYLNSTPDVATSTSTKSYANTRVWKTGNNKGFGLLYATGYGNWKDGLAGGSNTTDAYGYNTWMIGYPTNLYSGEAHATNRRDPMTGEQYTAKYTTTTSTAIQTVTGTTNKIYFISAGYSNDGDGAGVNGFDTDVLDFDGYQLLERVTVGIMTAGLLEGSLRTVQVNNVDYRVPVYRQETVEYIAYLLVNALKIPQKDANGNYNSNFVAGSKSSQFGGVDLNGDGQIGWINLDGDSRSGHYDANGNWVAATECNEESVDLATALRHCLGITLNIGQNVGTLRNSYEDTLGTYEKTLEHEEMLIGEFSTVRYSIYTAMDAAYFMLNSLFVANSFNQKQDDYYYLNMPLAEVTTNNHSGNAYVFDAGFTTGTTAANNTIFSDPNGTNQNAVVYSPIVDANNNPGTGTIGLKVDANGNSAVTGKTKFFFGSGTATSGTSSNWTTRFPFLPVTNATGDYAGQTKSYYFFDDDVRTYSTGSNSYIDRNYNYVMTSNGEFVYNESDALFFEFEGDDDVYLFINGELVLDIGAAHSITSVYIDVNDYVKKARDEMKELNIYGYTSDMSIEEFDALISSSTLEKYIYDESGRITGTETVPNRYSQEQRDEFKRWARLDLVDGQICQFDFYYMERHGWGANMRIVTNMHITDPSLNVDKSAYQYGQEIEYGGVIDPTAALEYNFSLTNSGNQKLYNLTFQDDVIGVKLDPVNGLTVNSQYNGVYVLDSNGKTLEAKDLTAVLTGCNSIGQYYEIPITFAEVNGDGGQTALKNLLKALDADGTEQGYDDAEITHAGSGLWVDATITIKGIHYMLTPDQTKAGTLHNTVYLNATTRIDPNTVGNKTLYSDADHLIYTSGFPVHYQWAGENIFINMAHLLEEAKEEAEKPGTQLNLYNIFFNSVDDLGDIHYNICDKYGRTDGYYTSVMKDTDKDGNAGIIVNYGEPGIYTFYLLLYVQQGKNASGVTQRYPASGIDAEEIPEGQYAIIRSQVYVADVEDAVFVLDYGLSTVSLDQGGELFKNDYLFGPYGTLQAKLMGVTNVEPSYLDPKTTSGPNYCRISFQNQNDATIPTKDGVFKVNLAIPGSGKVITYDATTGQYSLTGVGTVTIRAEVPTTNWDTPYLYYWYDDATVLSWPGIPMKADGNGRYEVDIPADVTNVIINNGSGALQTEDLKITPGLESTIYVSVNGNNEVSSRIETVVEEVTVHVKAPTDWNNVYLHHWHDNGDSTTYPGDKMTLQDDGYYSVTIHGDVTHLLVNDGSVNKTGDLTVYAGKEVWIDLSDTVSNTVEYEDGSVSNFYDASIRYTLDEGYKIHASVPNDWDDTIYVYYWHEGMSDDEMKWPGKLLTKDSSGYYTLPNGELVPADVTQIIINDGDSQGGTYKKHQTVDLSITPGLDTWITVNNITKNVTDSYGNSMNKYTATVNYGSESGTTGLIFTPNNFLSMEENDTNSIWLAVTVHSTSAPPSTLVSGEINIHKEVQMFKKITVIPATVVYYEDTFEAIQYHKDTTSGNVFIHHGNGSGRLTQSVDQSMPYGQDPTYQDNGNNLYSGQSLTAVLIKDTSKFATFTFKGTGFELISRTNAVDSASVVARIYKADDYTAYEEAMAKYQAGELDQAPKLTAYKVVPVITQFDHGNDGGAEIINQVPVIRATDMPYGEYTVELSGIPAYTFDDKYNVTGIADSYVYIDGLRIYQPLGSGNSAYSDQENNATFVELRDMILDGKVAVGMLEQGGLKLSTGTITWTENFKDNDFSSSTLESFQGIQVGSSGDYLIQGPNNEVYMEGNATNSALVFYVSEDGTGAHGLQLAVRALDYAKFYGAGTSAPDVQLQYGVLNNGQYEWKSLAHVVSSTEQYYTIPYAECPVDGLGRYQIVVRAVNAGTDTNALVSYTNVKLTGMKIAEVDGVGKGTMMYYENGMLVIPDIRYELVVINGAEFKELYTIPFTGNTLVLPMEQDVIYGYVRAWIDGDKYDYFAVGNPGTATSVDMYTNADGRGAMDLYKGNGEITFTITQFSKTSLNISYCNHGWDNGEITKQATCTTTGLKTYTCATCGDKRNETVPTNGAHTYSNGECVRCGKADPGYYLVGYINGANYGCEEDWTNLGQYKFVDGKLTVTFASNSYVFLKKGASNPDQYGWYMLYDYGTSHSEVFYNTATNPVGEKMYILGGTEVVFTLVENGNDTFTLSYRIACLHEWDDGTITRGATCTETGEKEFYCHKCGETRVEAIEKAEHNYKNGICTACGKMDTHVIYVTNSASWSTVYAHAWTDGTAYTGEWPGIEMNVNEEGLYYIELPTAAQNIVFHNGSGVQTADMTIPTVGKPIFDNAVMDWTVVGLDYYLVGWINGADYGCEADVDNMGEYKFVDGKLEVTFEQDSYVYVKTSGNLYWYMTNGWLGTDVVSATLYNTTSGIEANKVYAPAGHKLTFYIVVNDDDTLTLWLHAWNNGVITSPATCTQDGVITYTCNIQSCLQTRTEAIPATGHKFYDGVCKNCGAQDVQPVYFKNTNNWAEVYAYVYTEGGEVYSAAWPGDKMALKEGETDVYVYYVPKNAESIIFNNHEGVQTADLNAMDNGGNTYYFYPGQWIAPGGEFVKRTIYFRNTAGWETVSLWAWDKNEVNYTGGTWPGVTMTLVEGETDLYYYDLYTNATHCLFTNNGDSQTADQEIPTNGDCKYTYAADKWSALDVEPEISEEPTVPMLYLKPNGNWREDNAWFAAYCWNNGGNVWIEMTDDNGDGIYECQFPTGYTSVIFCRMNASTSDMSWDNKWDQTVDLTLPTDGRNQFSINEGDWGNANGSWSTYTRTRSAARMAGSSSKSAPVQVPDVYIAAVADNMNLASIRDQLSSTKIYGQLPVYVPDANVPGDDDQAEESVKISSVALALDNNIGVWYKATVPAGTTSAYMVFEFNGVITKVTDYTVDETGRYCFYFTGVNPQLMGDNICATMYATVNGKEVTDCVPEYSVRTYCVNMLSKGISAELETLISDMLVYGAQAQLRKGYKVNQLVTDGLLLTPSEFQTLDSSSNKQIITGNKNSLHDVVSAALVLGNSVAVRFGFVLDDPDLYTYEVTIRGNTLRYTAEDLTYDESNGRYYLDFTNLFATDFDEAITVAVMENGVQVSRTVVYSVNTYIWKNQNSDNESLRAILRAAYNYGKSAKAYKASKG